MNSSSEQVQSASYVPLEYRDACDPFDAGHSGQMPTASGELPPPCHVAEPAPDATALCDARIDEERRTMVAEAHQEAERQIQHARSEIACAIEHFAQQRETYFHEAEAEVVSLALAIVRRLIHRETQIDPGLLAGLVNYELEQLEATTSVRLLVSPDTFKYWKDAAPAMSRPVEVAVDKALPAGDARIETNLGCTTVSFERELKEIERGFFDLLSHRPEAIPVRVQ